MISIQRETEILQLLKEKNYATVDYLAEKIHISPSSIRRDLAQMESKGLIKRDHGGASLLPSVPGFAPFFSRLQEGKKEKPSLAKAASELVQPNSSLFIDSSATAMEIYKYLTSEMNLTCFSNNLLLTHLLAARKIKAYSIGGCVSERNNVITVGAYALDMLKSIYVDFMFFSSSSLSEDGVVSDLDEGETAIRRFMLSHSRTKVFLCPDNRFGKLSPFALCECGDTDYLVSGSDFSENFKKKHSRVTFVRA